MGKVRSWYVYLVSAITIQALTWATINLLRNLIIPGLDAPVSTIAFQISVVIITLPLFLVHWLWAQRTAAKEPEDRASLARLIYLYIMMTAFLAPLINNVFGFVRALLYLILGVAPSGYSWQTVLSPSQSAWFNLAPIIALGLLWFYHLRVRKSDEQIVPRSEAAAITHQVYLYLFATIGLVMSVVAFVNLAEWLLGLIFVARRMVADASRLFLASEISRLAVGLPVWLIFWSAAQRLFRSPDELERESVVRKAYLYLLVFISVMGVVSTATVVLGDIISRLLDLPSSGGDLRLPSVLVLTFGKDGQIEEFSPVTGEAKTLAL